MGDVREVADRLRAYAAGRLSPREYSALQYADDETFAISTFLAEHLADDGDAVTVGWLESVGFREAGCKRFSVALGVLIVSPPWGGFVEWWCAIANPEWRIGDRTSMPHTEILAPKTRGHVRRLCASLGIQLKESS